MLRKFGNHCLFLVLKDFSTVGVWLEILKNKIREMLSLSICKNFGVSKITRYNTGTETVYKSYYFYDLYLQHIFPHGMAG